LLNGCGSHRKPVRVFNMDYTGAPAVIKLPVFGPRVGQPRFSGAGEQDELAGRIKQQPFRLG